MTKLQKGNMTGVVNQQMRSPGDSVRNPNKAAGLLLGVVICSTIFADYWEYSRQYHANPDWWLDIIRGTGSAPAQYRIGVPWFADLLRRHGHMGLRHGFTLIDLFCAAIAVYLLFSIFQRSAIYRRASSAGRWFGAIAFVFLAQFYFAWITWYQRPETLASAATLAATLWLLTVRLPFAKSISTVLTLILMLALAAMQSFIRADVIFTAHLGILAVCLMSSGEGLSLSRKVQAITSVLAIAISGWIQFLLMHKVYPHANYGATPVFQLLLNLTDPLGIVPFLLFMLPWGWLAIALFRRRAVLDASSLAIVAGSAIYLAMWFTVGRIAEVRIFLPYAVALIPATCAVAIERTVPAA
jgi:hypothetical protein